MATVKNSQYNRAEGDIGSYDYFDGEYPDNVNCAHTELFFDVEEELPFGDPFE